MSVETGELQKSTSEKYREDLQKALDSMSIQAKEYRAAYDVSSTGGEGRSHSEEMINMFRLLPGVPKKIRDPWISWVREKPTKAPWRASFTLFPAMFAFVAAFLVVAVAILMLGFSAIFWLVTTIQWHLLWIPLGALIGVSVWALEPQGLIRASGRRLWRAREGR